MADPLQNIDKDSSPIHFDRSCVPFDRCRQAIYMVSLEEIDLLKFLLPGFCHLTAEDESRKILLSEEFHVFLHGYLTDCWRAFKDDESSDDSSESLVSLLIYK